MCNSGQAHLLFSGSFPFALDSSAHISNRTGPTSTFRIGTVLPPIDMCFCPSSGCWSAGIHIDVVPCLLVQRQRRLESYTFPGRTCSSRISMVRLNVQPSGIGDKLASEYAVRIIAALNESSRACFCIAAFAILYLISTFHVNLTVYTANQGLQLE
jgi:hypothetical protein